MMNPIQYAAILLTHNCNLRCSYCYAGDKVNRRMTFDTARSSIDFLHSQSDGKVVITFFGGEPLLEFKLIREIVTDSKLRYSDEVEFRLSTNGTLLSDEILEFLAEHKVYFTLSLDGGREQQDRLRIMPNGSGSFDLIHQHLEHILKLNPYTVVVSVVAPETVEYMTDGVQQLFGLGIRHVLQTLDYSAAWTPAHIKVLRKEYKRLAKWYEAELRAERKPYYSPFDERIKSWAQKPFEPGAICDLGNSQVAVAPSGRIYPCVQFIGEDTGESSEYIIGDVVNGFDEGRRSFVIERNLSGRPQCEGCDLNGRCANYCGCVNWRATGDILTIPPIVCEHERMLIPIVDQMANRLWKRGVRRFKEKFYDPLWSMSSFIEDCRVQPKGAE